MSLDEGLFTARGRLKERFKLIQEAIHFDRTFYRRQDYVRIEGCAFCDVAA
jgi:hypothetical protein